MHLSEKALSLAARGKPRLLMALLNNLVNKGHSIDRISDFAVKHYGLPKQYVRDVIVSILIN